MTDPKAIAELVLGKLKEMDLQTDAAKLNLAYIESVITLMKERVYTLNDFIEFGKYFFISPADYDEKGLSKHWNTEIKPVFKIYVQELESVNNWEAANLEEHLRNFAAKNNIKAAQLIHILRLSLTGITISPGIFELMQILGKNTVVERVLKFLNNT